MARIALVFCLVSALVLASQAIFMPQFGRRFHADRLVLGNVQDMAAKLGLSTSTAASTTQAPLNQVAGGAQQNPAPSSTQAPGTSGSNQQQYSPPAPPAPPAQPSPTTAPLPDPGTKDDSSSSENDSSAGKNANNQVPSGSSEAQSGEKQQSGEKTPGNSGENNGPSQGNNQGPAQSGEHNGPSGRPHGRPSHHGGRPDSNESKDDDDSEEEGSRHGRRHHGGRRHGRRGGRCGCNQREQEDDDSRSEESSEEDDDWISPCEWYKRRHFRPHWRPHWGRHHRRHHHRRMSSEESGESQEGGSGERSRPGPSQRGPMPPPPPPPFGHHPGQGSGESWPPHGWGHGPMRPQRPMSGEQGNGDSTDQSNESSSNSGEAHNLPTAPPQPPQPESGEAQPGAAGTGPAQNPSSGSINGFMRLLSSEGGFGGARRAGSGSSHSSSSSTGCFSSMMSYLNGGAQYLISLMATTGPLIKLWDAYPVAARFALLHQLPVLSLGFNVTAEVIGQNNNLTWCALPPNVKNVLYTEKQDHSLFTLTLAQMELVPASDPNANNNIFSYIPTGCQASLNTLIASLDSVNFNTTLNATAVQALVNYLAAAANVPGIPSNVATMLSALAQTEAQQYTALRNALISPPVSASTAAASVVAGLQSMQAALSLICPASGYG